MANKKKENLIKYFIAGIIAGASIFILLSFLNKNNEAGNINTGHIWSPETDSQFVKDCYNKYKPQIKDDQILAASTKNFCKCMLEKIKTKYSEEDMNKVTADEIKKWDAECRNRISHPNNFFEK